MQKKERKLKRICMLSTHGYFDPVPQLGPVSYTHLTLPTSDLV